MVDPVEPDADKVRGEATPAITPAPDVVGMTAPIADEKTVVTKAKSPVVKLVAAPAAKAPAPVALAAEAIKKVPVSRKTATKPARLAAEIKNVSKIKTAPKIKTAAKMKIAPPIKTAVKSPIKTPAKIILAPLARTATVFTKAPDIMTSTTEYTEKFQTVIKDASAKAKTAFEKSQTNLGEMGAFTKGNVEAIVESTKILASGLQAMTKGYATEGKSVFETLTAEMKSLAAVKSPSELLEKQSSLMRAHFDAAVAASSKNSEAMLKLANEAFQPISNRVSLAVEKIKHVA